MPIAYFNMSFLLIDNIYRRTIMYTFITNPNARSGLGIQMWKSIELVLKEKNILYEVFFTKYQHHATKIVRQITADHEPHTIIVLGGDGTINEVISGIVDLAKVTLGYIPIGSNEGCQGIAVETGCGLSCREQCGTCGVGQSDHSVTCSVGYRVADSYRQLNQKLPPLRLPSRQTVR